ncbi:MAG: alpha/beta hydrolase [Sphingobium sp.]|nr:alpha/beta hydrolase [Sphingobium sp.]
MRFIPQLPVALMLAGMAQLSIAQTRSETAVLKGGAEWRADVPRNWNGTLLLYSRGYSPVAGKAESAPRQMAQQLLDAGYALAGSNYGAGGWSLAEAIPAQTATLAAFAAKYGKPKRTIAWGSSMGGLVTTALAEKRGAGIDGALAMCASIGGAVGMMNMALDGAYAFKTLVAPDSAIRLVGIDDDRTNAQRVVAALDAAMKTPEGRARVALAGVLAGIPGWTSRDHAEPAANDFNAQADEIGRAFAMGVFLPRTDQEARAGGIFSWNSGIDYRAQLEKSGRRPLVEALYHSAGLDLEADLSRLNSGTRVTASSQATDYMLANYTPNARPLVPIIAVQMIGDGATSPALQRGYMEAAPANMAHGLYVRGAGHCTFDAATTIAALGMLERRITKRGWSQAPAPFISYVPQPMMRPCVRGKICK